MRIGSYEWSPLKKSYEWSQTRFQRHLVGLVTSVQEPATNSQGAVISSHNDRHSCWCSQWADPKSMLKSWAKCVDFFLGKTKVRVSNRIKKKGLNFDESIRTQTCLSCQIIHSKQKNHQSFLGLANIWLATKNSEPNKLQQSEFQLG
jgi:hypothetical protein